MSTFTLKDLAERLGGEITGDPSLELTGLNTIEDAGSGDITFLANKKYEKYLATTGASAVIVDTKITIDRGDLALLRMKDPYFGFVQCLHLFFENVPQGGKGRHPDCTIDESADIHEDAWIAARAVVGKNSRIGEASVDLEGCVIADDVIIGDNVTIEPNVTILGGTRIGNRVIIHAGATVGTDGFGFAPVGERYVKIPQVGHVIVEDDVEIGANTCIDRGTLGPTVIRQGAKLDNLIQIAHNVDVGENTVIAAQTGISGSTTLGKHVLIGGQVGLVGHLDIGDNVTFGAQAGVSKSIDEPGKIFRGSPAREIHEELRLEAAMRHLPDLIKTVRQQEKRIAGQEKRIAELENKLLENASEMDKTSERE